MLRAALLLAVLLAPAREAQGQRTLTQEEALKLAFPASQVARRTAYLEDAQLAEARRLAGRGVPVTQRVVTYYAASRGGRPLGTAYFDSHRVRTLGEVLMVVVDPAGAVQRVEVVRFAEPAEYRPPDGWLEQFEGKRLAPDLAVRRGIANLTGATLTSRAVTEAVRRVLALHAVILPHEK